MQTSEPYVRDFMHSVMGAFQQDLGQKIDFYADIHRPPAPQYVEYEPPPRPPPPPPNSYAQMRAATSKAHKVRFAQPPKSRGRGAKSPAA